MINKKKILMISSTSKIGGGPKHIFTLSSLINKTFDFYYALPNLPEINNLQDGKYIKISERKLALKDIYKLFLFVKLNSIDIVHAHGKGAAFIARVLKIFSGKSIVITFHGMHIQCYGKIYQKFYILYENIFGKIDDHTIFVSNGELEYARKNKIYIGKKYSIINNAVKNKKLRKIHKNFEDYFVSNYNLSKKVNIISVCRLVDQKNIFEIFRIAKILKNYDFFVLGGGDLLYKAKLFLKEQNILNVHLLGEKKDVFRYLDFADLFLSTSLYEGLPISLLEAMSIGLPIVATNVSGNKDVVTHNHTGLLYELNDVFLAAKYIDLLIKDHSLNIKFTNNSQKIQRAFYSTKNFSENYIKLYRNI